MVVLDFAKGERLAVDRVGNETRSISLQISKTASTMREGLSQTTQSEKLAFLRLTSIVPDV
jgi:hypothetical protein